MKHLARQFEFWIMVAAWVAHSLSSTMWTAFGFITWAIGMGLIWVLYLCCRAEEYEVHHENYNSRFQKEDKPRG